jgi:pilus assembly protein CpaF
MTATLPQRATWDRTEFERLIQEKAVQQHVIRAMAEALRAVHGSDWLVAFYNPGDSDQAVMGLSVRNAFQQLYAEGRAPAWEELQQHVTDWLTRYLQGRTDRVAKLRDVIERTATRKSAATPNAGGSELILTAETRSAMALDVARDLPMYLGPEQLEATEAETLALAEWLVRENLGAGALEPFLLDAHLTEIMVGAGGRIWVEREGKVLSSGQTLPEVRAVWFAQRLAALIGSRIDQSEPSMDGFLADGSRVHVMLSPVAMDGVSITIRRHTRRPSLAQLIDSGAMTEELAAFLQTAVAGKANILISGGTSSGKTTLLNAVASFISPLERVLTMEDAPELRLPLPHVIRMRTRKQNIEGRGEFTMRMLVKESLRMRPDRIVVGEVRGAEALDMIESMNTGHDGCLSTAHANGPVDMLKRLGQMMKRGDPQLTDSGAYELIASAIHLLVHAERRVGADGQVVRGVMEVVEVESYQPDRKGTAGFTLRPLFHRGADRVLRQVGAVSDRLALQLRLNGAHPDRWVRLAEV